MLVSKYFRVVAVAFFVTALNAAPLPAMAAEPDSSSLAFQDWTVNCAAAPAKADANAKAGDKAAAPASAPSCEMVQSFVDKTNQRLVARVAIGRPQGEAELKLVILAPVGVYLPDGAALAVNDKLQAKAVFVRCSPQACFAEADAKKELLDAAKGAEKLTLTFADGARHPVAMNVSTKGFAAALAALDKK
jgi:invasion protein IalB